MESPVEAPVEYPDFRAEVVGAVRALSDIDYQRRVWIHHDFPPGVRYDELAHRIHILFDDTDALLEPGRHVGAILYLDEPPPLLALGAVLDPLITELGDVGDAEYLAHPRWSDVVARAADAYRVMHANDVAHHTPT